MLCWLEAADRGLHRIVSIEKIGPLQDDPAVSEVVARMSDGGVVRVFTFRPDALSFSAEELLDLSVEQAVSLRVERDLEFMSQGSHIADYRECCLLCGANH